MAGGMQTPDGLNVDLNLVPFIDLLSSLVLFLLLSAVWLQVSAIPANVEGKGAAKAVVAKPPQRLEIRVTKSALKLRWPAAFAGRPKEFRREAAGTFPWEKLKQTLEPAKAGGKTPVLESASVGGDEGVPYGEIIEALDTAKAAGVPSVAIAMD